MPSYSLVGKSRSRQTDPGNHSESLSSSQNDSDLASLNVPPTTCFTTRPLIPYDQVLLFISCVQCLELANKRHSINICEPKAIGMEKLEWVSVDATLSTAEIQTFWEGYGITLINIGKSYFFGKYFSFLVAHDCLSVWWDPDLRTQISCAQTPRDPQKLRSWTHVALSPYVWGNLLHCNR